MCVNDYELLLMSSIWFKLYNFVQFIFHFTFFDTLFINFFIKGRKEEFQGEITGYSRGLPSGTRNHGSDSLHGRESQKVSCLKVIKLNYVLCQVPPPTRQPYLYDFKFLLRI